jgi:hypothetical protein
MQLCYSHTVRSPRSLHGACYIWQCDQNTPVKACFQVASFYLLVVAGVLDTTGADGELSPATTKRVAALHLPGTRETHLLHHVSETTTLRDTIKKE